MSEFVHGTPPSPTKTVVIRHGVSLTSEQLFEAPVGFPVGGILTPFIVFRAVLALLAYQVPKYEGNLFHGYVHQFGMYDLLNSVSQARAVELGIHRVEGRKAGDNAQWVAFGVRWELSTANREARVFGPQSSPDNELLIDLTEKK